MSTRLTKKLATLAIRSTGLPGAHAVLETREVRFDHRIVRFDREEERHVDVEPLGDERAASPFAPAAVPGTLIITFGRSTIAQRRFASATVASASCAAPGETSIETSPSAPCGPVVDRAEAVAGIADVGGLHQLEELPRARAGRRRGDLRIVRRPFGERLLEDRRVRRHPRQRVLGDLLLELPTVEHRAIDVVEPDRLAGVMQLVQRILGHGRGKELPER